MSHVYIKSTIDSAVYEFDYDVSTTIDELSNLLSAKSGLPVWEQQLLFGGKHLEWHRTLSTYAITAGTTLHMVQRTDQSEEEYTALKNSGGTCNVQQVFVKVNGTTLTMDVDHALTIGMIKAKLLDTGTPVTHLMWNGNTQEDSRTIGSLSTSVELTLHGIVRPTKQTKQQPALIKSTGDKDRTYRHITLANGLECTLVSDSTTDKASAAMQVNVGHLSDPTSAPGLAHFLEHMLFQGTTTYPGPATYKKFLSDHGGSSNASTGMVHTTYFFDVTHPHLEAAVSRFSKFFIEPLFDTECTDRELNAVNSENAKNVLNDYRRLFQLSKCLSDPGHSYSKFGTGNRQTLSTTPKENNVDVRELLLAFHKEFYSANIMKLCILGRGKNKRVVFKSQHIRPYCKTCTNDW